jgi:hypothetical protein
MKSNILRENGIVERIIGDLSVYGDIPNKGFLGGGAVANLLMSYVWGEDYPINDLDIFIEDDGDTIRQRPNSPVRSANLSIEGDGYMVTKLSFESGTTYRIMGVEREGMLNTIVISKIYDREKRKDYNYILNGFDFNCCQVGIDLESNKLFYTEDFENFLNNKQLEVTAIYTPSHTAIRLFKKIDELKCYCNVDECMELLSQPLITENILKINKTHFGLYFSLKYRDMYMKYYTNIKEYFKMVRLFDHKKRLWIEKHKGENNIPSTHTLAWLDNKTVIPQQLLDSWAKHSEVIWTLEPKKFIKPNKVIMDVLKDMNFNPLTFMNAYRITTNKLNKKLKEKANKVLTGNYKLCKMLAIVDSDFYDCDFDEKHLDYVENFVDSERWALVTMVRERMNVQESYNLIKDIKKILNKEGEWVSELISQYLHRKNKAVKPTYENILNGISKEKEKYCVSLIKPLSLDDLKLPNEDIKIKELTTELDLRWAGKKLNNCMNNSGQNYAGKIKSGKTKLFVIMTKNNMSGLEFELVEDTVYRIVQILSYCNKVTSEYHKTVGNLLANYLNMKHLKEIYESKMSSFVSIDLLNRSFLLNLKDEKTSENPTALFGEGLYGGGIVMEEELTEEYVMEEELTEEGIRVELPNPDGEGDILVPIRNIGDIRNYTGLRQPFDLRVVLPEELEQRIERIQQEDGTILVPDTSMGNNAPPIIQMNCGIGSTNLWDNQPITDNDNDNEIGYSDYRD